MQSEHFISAIVCIGDGSYPLSTTWEALAQQTLPEDRFEVVVVDSGPPGDRAEVVVDFCAKRRNYRYIREDRVGCAIARNAGVRAAAGGIVVFTHDCVEPTPNWLERILARFSEHPDSAGVVGGDVQPVWETQRPGWLTDPLLRPLCAGLHWSREARFLRPGEWLVDINCAYDKAVLIRAGGFPEHLDRGGDSLRSADGLVSSVIERMGHKLFYDPQITVHHHIPAWKSTPSWFRHHAFWQGVSANLVDRYFQDTMSHLPLLEIYKSGDDRWEEVTVPASASAWAELFSDASSSDLLNQLVHIRHIGYLLESQSVILGR